MTMFNKKITVASVSELEGMLPFYFNRENSDIFVEPFCDGSVEVTVFFGTGKGWDTLSVDLLSAIRDSYNPWDTYEV